MNGKTAEFCESVLNESIDGQTLTEEEKEIYRKFLNYMLGKNQITDLIDPHSVTAEKEEGQNE